MDDTFDCDATPARPSWFRFASCRGIDPDLFFPERGAATKPAKAICRRCIVREECLAYALATVERFGIWGGTSERERRIMRRRINQAAAS